MVAENDMCEPSSILTQQVNENCMTNGLAYKIFKNFTNKTNPNSSKYIPCKILAYLTLSEA